MNKSNISDFKIYELNKLLEMLNENKKNLTLLKIKAKSVGMDKSHLKELYKTNIARIKTEIRNRGSV